MRVQKKLDANANEQRSCWSKLFEMDQKTRSKLPMNRKAAEMHPNAQHNLWFQAAKLQSWTFDKYATKFCTVISSPQGAFMIVEGKSIVRLQNRPEL